MKKNQDKKIKIVYLLPGGLYNSGGMERVTSIKANYLADAAGYDVSIVTTEQMGRPVFYPLSEKVTLYHLNIGIHENFGKENYMEKCISRFRKARQYRIEIEKLLLEIRPDITVTTLGLEIDFINKIKDGSVKIGELHFPGNFRSLMARKLSVGFIPNLVARIRTNNMQKQCRKLTRLIVLTEEEKTSWKNNQNVVVIANPLPVFPDKISSLEQKKAIAVGRLAHEKGFDLLIDAWKAVAEKHPDWSLDIVGGGNQKEILLQKITDNGLDEMVKIREATDNIYDYYQNHSMLIFPSRYLESFGMVQIEAMSCGLPVVAFNAPCGPKDIISDGMNGFLVKTGDTEGLSEKILTLIESDDLRQTMGKAARKTSENYRVEKVMQLWERTFGELPIQNSKFKI